MIHVTEKQRHFLLQLTTHLHQLLSTAWTFIKFASEIQIFQSLFVGLTTSLF